MSEAPYSPAEPPADGDRTSQVPPAHGGQPRYSASASVPVPPAGSPGGQNPSPYGNQAANPFGQGSPYGQQGSPYGQDPQQGGPGSYQPPGNQPPSNQPPSFQSPTSGQARAAASASVPAPATQPNPPPYGNPPQGYSSPGGTYGSPSGQGQQYGTPTSQFGSVAPGQGYGGPGGPQGGQPQGGQPQGQPGYGGPSYDRQAMPSPMGQGSYSAPGTYGQPAADPGRPRDGYGQPVGQPGGQPGGPQGGQPAWAESEPQAPVRKSRKGLIIALIVAAVVLVVGVGGYVGWSLTNRGSAFTVGACVKPDGGDAVVTDCSTSGAFKITNIVDTENGCTDPNQPSLVLTERVGGGHKWACLAPAAS